MHFHRLAQCMNCGRKRLLSTDVPDIVILASMCEECGWNDLVGCWVDGACAACLDLWKQGVEREHERMMHHP